MGSVKATEREEFWRRFNEEIEQARQRVERENDSYPHADFCVEDKGDDLCF